MCFLWHFNWHLTSIINERARILEHMKKKNKYNFLISASCPFSENFSWQWCKSLPVEQIHQQVTVMDESYEDYWEELEDHSDGEDSSAKNNKIFIIETGWAGKYEWEWRDIMFAMIHGIYKNRQRLFQQDRTDDPLCKPGLQELKLGSLSWAYRLWLL